jgi:hypothetical protein
MQSEMFPSIAPEANIFGAFGAKRYFPRFPRKE